MRGMGNLMMDFFDHPDFVRELLHTIADYNIAQVRKAVEFDIDTGLSTQKTLLYGTSQDVKGDLFNKKGLEL